MTGVPNHDGSRHAAVPPLTGVIYNPRSHRNMGRELDAQDRGVIVARPGHRDELRVALEDFARRGVELLVINGGDGTVRDVLTCGMGAFAGAWPRIAVLPKGKTNALNVDLGAPADWAIADAIDAAQDGREARRRPLMVRSVDDADDEADLVGFVMGAGAIATGIHAGQDAHKMGAFNSLAVGVTAAWGVIQLVFGSNRNVWRRGVPMRVLVGPERRELPHAKTGDPARRNLLLASTLERFPFGMRPFGDRREGLKLAVMDAPLRKVVAAIPMVAAGWQSDWLARNGVHRATIEEAELTLGGPFVLDGETFPPGRYLLRQGPELRFVVP
jgi:hypothetical protein